MTGNLDEITTRTIERTPVVFVDDQSKVIGVYQHQNLLKIVPTTFNRKAFPLRLIEENILSICFLATDFDLEEVEEEEEDGDKSRGRGRGKKDPPPLAILSKNEHDTVVLKTYQVLMEQNDLQEGDFSKSYLDPTSTHLIPMKMPWGGIIVVGGQTVVYYSMKNKQYEKKVAIEPTVIKTVARVDERGLKYLLGDHKGQLLLLNVQVSEGLEQVTGLQLQKLGTTSVSTTISYLDNGYVYVGSTSGDSQIVKLNNRRNIETGMFLEFVQSFTQLGPITDFCFVKGSKHAHQGQGQIVTCSGVLQDGSLRVVRNGIGISEQASVEIPGIKEMVSLKKHFDDKYHTFLLQSFANETRVLAMISFDEMGETEIRGFDANSPTLCAGNMAGDILVQVTVDAIHIVDGRSLDGEGREKQTWTPPNGQRISVAACNRQQLLLGTVGGNLYYFEVDRENGGLLEKSNITLDCEIACLDCSTLNSDGEEGRAKLAAVGLWAQVGRKPVVKLMDLPTLTTTEKDELDENAMARDVLLVSLALDNYLIVALGDGHLLTYQVQQPAPDGMGGGRFLSQRRKISVGTQPASLSVFRSQGQNCVFASSDRPTALYSATNGRKILVSNVNLREVRRVCSFHSDAFPDCLAIATEDTLELGTVDEIQKLHIDRVPLGEGPRRIVHMAHAERFAVACEGLRIDERGDEIEQVSIKLVDDTGYTVTDVYKLDPDESALSFLVTSFVDEANDRKDSDMNGMSNGYHNGDDMDSGDKGMSEYLLVGTMYAGQGEEAEAGRLLVFRVADGKFVTVCIEEVRGAAFCMAQLRHKLLVGVNDTVHLFSLHRRQDGRYRLREDLRQTGRLMVYDLHTRGDFILVGDIIRSLHLLRYHVENGEEKFVELSRDYDTVWLTASEIIDDDTFVVAENWMNLMTYKRNSYSAIEHERAVLKRVGQFHLGSLVNRIREGSLATTAPEADSLAQQTMVFVTVDGMIGVIATLQQQSFEFLERLEKAMSARLVGVGNLNYEQWRNMYMENPCQDVPAKNFIDGDLVERFSELPRKEMKAIAAETNSTTEEILKLVEELQRLH